ncbi:MAG TPA: protocatechuate 3,4-dioxygenase subunit alpha [Verrucomicrobiae bacterium]|nr:protocatechuate 3,4-dioxygenase subunit alpha [Verrucomicrobiae bacterium]
MSGRTTPSQTVGPFFSIGFTWLNRVDLTEGAAPENTITIRGRVLDGDGQPVPDAVLEIWQANSNGKYAHPEDAAELVGSEAFWGFGRVPVNDMGEFCFQTIKPGLLAGPTGTRQAPHLAVSVFMRGLLKRLVTRIYFAGDSGNGLDPVLAQVPESRRQTLIARAKDSQGKILVWDVHLQGAEETVFFDC